MEIITQVRQHNLHDFFETDEARGECHQMKIHKKHVCTK